MLQNTRAFRASSGIIPGSSCYPPSDAERGGSTLRAPSSQKIPGWGCTFPKIPGWGAASLPPVEVVYPSPNSYQIEFIFFSPKTLMDVKIIFNIMRRVGIFPDLLRNQLCPWKSPVSFNRCSSWKYLNKKMSQFHSHSLEKGPKRNHNVSWDFYKKNPKFLWQDKTLD